MIPKIIWQTHKWKYEDLPQKFKKQCISWQKMNPGWEYRYVSDSMAIEMLKEYSVEWGEDLLEIYNRISSDGVLYDGNGGASAHQADLWRYLTIYSHGGIYVDVDTECIEPLDNMDLRYHFVHENKPMLIPDGKGSTYYAHGPHFFGGSKKSFMIKIMCMIAIEHLRSQKNNKINGAGIGPGLFTNSIKYFNIFNSDLINGSLNNTPHGKDFK